MEEEKKEIEEVEEQEPLADNSKVEFPLAGIIIIGILGLLMIACIVVLGILRNR